MEHSKLATGNGHGAQIGRSASPAQQDQMSTVRWAGKKAVQKKTAVRKAKLSRPLWKKTGSESKSNRLVCRYCGSEDLAPSFIKRRDRRCRKCFSKRYGSAARAKKAKVKEVASQRGIRDRTRRGVRSLSFSFNDSRATTKD